MSELDPVIHPLNRFKICATLNAFGATQGGDVNQEMKFAILRARTAPAVRRTRCGSH